MRGSGNTRSSGNPRFYFDSSALLPKPSTPPPGGEASRALDTLDVRLAVSSASPSTAQLLAEKKASPTSRTRQRRAAHWNEGAVAISGSARSSPRSLSAAGMSLLTSSPLAGSGVATAAAARKSALARQQRRNWETSGSGMHGGATVGVDALDRIVGALSSEAAGSLVERQRMLDPLDPHGPSELRPRSSSNRGRARRRPRARSGDDGDPFASSSASPRGPLPGRARVAWEQQPSPPEAKDGSGSVGYAESKRLSPSSAAVAAARASLTDGEVSAAVARRADEALAAVAREARAGRRREQRERWRQSAPPVEGSAALGAARSSATAADLAMQHRIVRVRQQMPAQFLREHTFSQRLQSFCQGFGADIMRRMLAKMVYSGQQDAFTMWRSHTLALRQAEAQQRAGHFHKVARLHKVAHKMLTVTYDKMAFTLKKWHSTAQALRRIERRTMAIRIQNAFRSHRARRLVHRRRARRNARRQRRLARQLQQAARAHAARKLLAKLRAEFFLDQMVTRIASRWRGRASRAASERRRQMRLTSIGVLQRAWRMHAARVELARLRLEHLRWMQARAALLLQRAALCWLARSELRKKRLERWGIIVGVMGDLVRETQRLVGTRRLQRAWRRFERCARVRAACAVLRATKRNAVRRIAAMRIQFARRCFVTRRRLWRRLLLAATLLHGRRNCAALAVQRHLRGALGRRVAHQRRVDTDAATFIQAKWRGIDVRNHSVVWQLADSETRWRYAVMNLLIVQWRRRHLRRRVMYRWKRHRERTLGKAMVGWRCFYKQSKGMWELRRMGAAASMLIRTWRRASRRRAWNQWHFMWKEIGDYLAQLEEMRAYHRHRTKVVTLRTLRSRVLSAVHKRQRHAHVFCAGAMSATMNGARSSVHLSRALALEELHLKTDYLRWLGRHAKWRIERERIAAEACERGWRRNVQLRNWNCWWLFILATRRSKAATRMGAAIWCRRALRRFVGGILVAEEERRVAAMAHHFRVTHFGERAFSEWRRRADEKRGFRLRAAAGARRIALARAAKTLFRYKQRKISLRRCGDATAARRRDALLRVNTNHWYKMWQVERMRVQHEAANVMQCLVRRVQALHLVRRMRHLKAYQKTISTERELDVLDLDGRNPNQHRDCALDIRCVVASARRRGRPCDCSRSPHCCLRFLLHCLLCTIRASGTARGASWRRCASTQSGRCRR